MDYEKAYKSLVAKVKKAHLFAQTDSTKKVLEDILPQLRESEDEMRRKMCIAAVNIAASVDGGLLHSEASECLAWLEEQKDKNCLACDQHLKGYIAGRKTTEEEKQKELPFVKDVMLGYPGLYFYDGERMHFRGPAMEEKQKEQKPAEWSEEDEQNYKVLLSIVHGTYVVETQETMDKLLSWLKSLRPSWKPSEEQMEALESAVKLNSPTVLDLHCMGMHNHK